MRQGLGGKQRFEYGMAVNIAKNYKKCDSEILHAKGEGDISFKKCHKMRDVTFERSLKKVGKLCATILFFVFFQKSDISCFSKK